MFSSIFKNTSLAVRFVIALSSILVIGCGMAIILLQFKETLIIDEVNSRVLQSLQQFSVASPEGFVADLDNRIDSVLSAFIFELSLMMVGISVFVVTAVYIIFTVLVRKRLAGLAVKFRNVAEGDGDLTSRITLQGNDGIDKLGHQFNNLIEKMQSTMIKVVDASNQVTSASANVAENTEKTSADIMQQRSETDQIATAMNQMSATSQEVAGNAMSASDAAQHAQTESIEGKTTVESTIQAINNLASEVNQSNDVIKQLQDDSENIGSVLDVIRGIAEQTNLLALNAAIEAARAGEQGRGFAVVADEVRTLASRTQQSTEEIQTMIEKLQTGANSAAAVMKSSHAHAQESVELASNAGNALDKITQAVITINEMNTHISHSANEQQSVVASMDQNLTSISQSSNATVEASQNTLNEIQELSRTATELQDTLAQFKI